MSTDNISRQIMDGCPVCREPLTNLPTNTLGKKGCASIILASKERNVDISAVPHQKIHQKCRRNFCNSKDIKRSLKRKSDYENEGLAKCKNLRSNEPAFSYSDHCIFCGKPDKYDGRKEQHKLIKVAKTSLRDNLIKMSYERADELSCIVRSRATFVPDLIPVHAVYHHTCYSNFRSGKQLPACFTESPKSKSGRPKDETRYQAFIKVMNDLSANDEEQTTVGDLIESMRNVLGDSDCEAYGFTHMKQKLREHFGDEVVITEINGKPNVVTFRKQVSSILSTFYQKQKKIVDDENEKLHIVTTAAELLKADIKAVTQPPDVYPTSHDMATIDDTLSFLPTSLQTLLRVLFVGKGKDLKIGSIGQAIMQATRPRVLTAPLNLGLGVQMSHRFGSRFLVDTLHAHGYSCSYAEVQSFRKSAALTMGNDTQHFFPGQFMQYIADNVDHDIATIDGKNTFHGMGIIASVSPKISSSIQIPRLSVNAADLREVGRINIKPFTLACGGLKAFQYERLPDFHSEDPTSAVDLLWKVTLTVRCPRPSWSGLMQMVHHGDHADPASIVYLPMIDLDPTNLTCINSTLHFICQHAERYNVTPVLTFDQPLWFKALSIIQSEPTGSKLKSVVLRLGGFHTLMSFLGSIGHIMGGSGLFEVLELVYASNSISHMMSGKATARATRGHLLVHAALNSLLLAKAFDFSCTNILLDGSCQDEPRFEIPSELERAGLLYDGLISGKLSIMEVSKSDVMQKIGTQVQETKISLKDNRTATLWLQYMDMVDIMLMFIKAERTGNWELHLSSLSLMIPYLAASGHNLYAKSLHIYLQEMGKLPITHPEVNGHFLNGHHVIRRSDRYWAGLSPDLVIEQVLMRGLKSNGGLTRGRGMTETQRLVWVMSSPVCAEVNNTLQDLTSVKCETSEQHKDAGVGRQKRDTEDTKKILEALIDISPFSIESSSSLVNIVNGVTSRELVNADRAKDVGAAIHESMVGKCVGNFVFRKKAQVVTMDTKSSLKMDDETVHIDPQLLFQRLVIAGTQAGELRQIFSYELYTWPPALFESKHMMLEADKAALGATMKQRSKPLKLITKEVSYVLDGGSLLQKVPWSVGDTYEDILGKYVAYVSRKYGDAPRTIIFDGYENGPNTKDPTHSRRSGKQGPRIKFTRSMSLPVKKQIFLANQENKQQLIFLLGDELTKNGCHVVHADGDADYLIAKTATEMVQTEGNIVLVGEDTDLIVLLCYLHQSDSTNSLYFMSEPRKDSLEPRHFYDIGNMQQLLGPVVCQNILFVHAILGSDTTSRVFGLGKIASLTLVEDGNESFLAQAKVFDSCSSSVDDVISAGEKAMVIMYKGNYESLDGMRYEKFKEKVAVSRTCLHPRVLPPTKGSMKYHSLRVYHQVQAWKGNDLDPLRYGWKEISNKLVPITTDDNPAPQHLLQRTRCTCKNGCGVRCGCRGRALPCTTACSGCKGVCSNMDLESAQEDYEEST